MSQYRFESHYDLARLPYFELRGGRLVLADPDLGPTVDMHTHLALSYVLPGRVDLRKLHPRTEHYLPMESPLDLELYANRNFRPGQLQKLSRDLTLYAVTSRGMRATHTAPNLRREMADLGVVTSVLLAIDYPTLSRNAEAWLDATASSLDLVCFGSVHPWARDPERRLDRQKALGAKGIKVHPAVQMIYPDSDRSMALYRMCGARDLPILFHCGPVDIEPPAGRRRSQVFRYERALAECPETTFVLGHSGALQWEEALALANRYPNAWLEVSCQSLGAIRAILEKGPRARTMFGSDWPFYHQAMGLAKVLIATEEDRALRAAVLHGNAARLLGLGSLRRVNREAESDNVG